MNTNKPKFGYQIKLAKFDTDPIYTNEVSYISLFMGTINRPKIKINVIYMSYQFHK